MIVIVPLEKLAHRGFPRPPIPDILHLFLRHPMLDSILGCKVANEDGEVFIVSCYKMLANSPMWVYIGLRSESDVLYYVSLERYDEMIQLG